MSGTFWKGLGAAVALAACVGCNTLTVMQSVEFANEDGDRIHVAYGRLDSEHETKFRSPANGKTLTMKSKLGVDVEMSDGDSFRAYQCMNFLKTGTLYRSDDDEWVFHAAGFVSRVFRRTPDGKDHKLVFEGVICSKDRAGGLL